MSETPDQSRGRHQRRLVGRHHSSRHRNRDGQCRLRKTPDKRRGKEGDRGGERNKMNYRNFLMSDQYYLLDIKNVQLLWIALLTPLSPLALT